MASNREEQIDCAARPNEEVPVTGSPGSSPSTWLNLDGDDVGEWLQETSEGPTTSEPSRRHARGRGQNKMPQGRYVVTVVTTVGEPTEPSDCINKFRRACGCLARDYVPIKIRA